MTRVVVTGLGPVSNIGIGVPAYEAGLRAGVSGISPIQSFDASGFPHRNAGEIADFEPASILTSLALADWGRTSHFAAAAARLAVTDAGLDPASLSGGSAGVAMGTTSGESVAVEQVVAQIVQAGLPGVRQEQWARLPAQHLAEAAATELGLSGPVITIATACSASNYAIGYGYDQIASDEVEVMVVGGADSVCRWAHAGFYRLGALAETHCSPFDADRGGMITAEGGAALLLESLPHALARGARIYAEVLGYAVNCDAKHPVAPDEGSIAGCMSTALDHAGVKPSEVDYVCAHGTGTKANDLTEVAALRQVYGDQIPPVSSVKSMIGHTMGAASGFGAIASVLAIARSFLPPTVNFHTLDPALGEVDPVANVARDATVRVAQNNGFAFGGNNAITIFGALDAEAAR